MLIKLTYTMQFGLPEGRTDLLSLRGHALLMLPELHSTYDPSLILSLDSCLLFYLTSTDCHFPLAHSTHERTVSADRPQMWRSRRFQVTNDSC
jgi:hypothetical protein